MLWKIESDVNMVGYQKIFFVIFHKAPREIKLIVVTVRLYFMKSDVFPEYVIFMHRHVWCENP